MGHPPVSSLERRRRSAAAVVLGAALLAARVQGQEDPAARTIAAYEAPASCPDRDAFLAMVRSYLDPMERPGLPPPFSVRYSQVTGGVLGALRTPEGHLARELQTSSCHETALALAYIVALSISPNAAPGKGPAAPSASLALSSSAASASTPPLASSAPPAPPSASVASPPASSTAPPPASPQTSATTSAPLTPTSPANGPWFHAGLRNTSVGSERAFAPVADVQRPFGIARLGLGLSLASRQTRPRDVPLRFGQLLLEPEACFSPTWENLSLGLCGALRFGLLRVASSDIPNATQTTAGLLSPALQGHADLRLVGPLWLGLRAGLAVSALRPGFFLNGSDQELQRMPLWIPEVGIALGFH
jgi:hypothetical protein